MGINDAQFCAKFLEIENCTLEQALSIVQKQTQITVEAKQIGMGSGQPPINSISNGRPLAPQPVNFTGNPDLHPCLSLGGRHKRQDCKFRQAKCNKCHKKGHLARFCKSKINMSPPVENARKEAT